MKKSLIRRLFILSVIVSVIVVSTAMNSLMNRTEDERMENVEFRLATPQFLLASAATLSRDPAFPENEAGISAYLRPTTSINLTIAKSAFATIDEEELDYIKGTVAVNGMTEDEYPYVWVSSDGWIIAYIPRDYKSEALITPFGYDYKTTTLAEAIKKVCNAIEVNFDYDEVGYYHFKFPDANGMVVVLESVTNIATDEFWVNISKDATIYNISWVYYSNGGGNWAKLDGKTFVSGYANPHKKWGFFSESEFTKGVDHRVEVHSDWSYGWAKIGLVIIYKS